MDISSDPHRSYDTINMIGIGEIHIEYDHAAHNRNIKTECPEMTESDNRSRSDTTACMENGDKTESQLSSENEDIEYSTGKGVVQKG